jgi:cytochrome P450
MGVREAEGAKPAGVRPAASGEGAPLGGASLTEPHNIARPHDFYRRMRRDDPVYFDEKLGMHLVSRHEDIWTVLKDPITYSFKHGYFDTYGGGFFAEFKAILERDGQGYFPDVIMEDPPAHTRVRGLTEKAFTAHRVASLEPRMAEIAADLIEALLTRCERGEAVDGVTGYSGPFTVRVICEQLGIGQFEADKIQRWATAYVAQISCMQNREMMLENAAQVCELQNFIIAEMKARSDEPREDMISDIVHAKLEDGTALTFAEAVSVVRAIIVGGHETTATALSNLLFLAATRPEIERQLREAAEDDRKLTRFVEELLRFAPPSRALARTTTREVELGGKRLPKGAHLLIVFESGNDDETAFACPREFDPERANLGKHVAFGGGVHRCIGAALARGELKVSARELARRVGRIKLAVAPDEIEYMPTVATHTIKALPLIVTRRV